MNRLLVFLFCLSYFFTPSPNASGTGKVLLVHSYHAGYLWTDDITRGVKKGLAGSRAELEIFYMDTKRNPGEVWKIQAGKLAKKRVAETKPNVVITADENAQAYFAKDYVGQAYPQIVFCGVNAEASKYGYPASNVTGILERPYFVQSFDMLKVAMGLVNAEAIEIAVEEGIGVAFISRLAAARGLDLGRIVEVEVEGMKLFRKIYLARNQRFPATRAQGEFWKFVLEPEVDLMSQINTLVQESVDN